MECVNCHRKRGDLLVARCGVCVNQCEYLSLTKEPWIEVNMADTVPDGYRKCTRCRLGCPVDWFIKQNTVCSCCRKFGKTVEPEIERSIKAEMRERKRASRNQRIRLDLYHCKICNVHVMSNCKSNHFSSVFHREGVLARSAINWDSIVEQIKRSG